MTGQSRMGPTNVCGVDTAGTPVGQGTGIYTGMCQSVSQSVSHTVLYCTVVLRYYSAIRNTYT